MSVRSEEFRDSINTITKEGKRNWIFAKQPKGKLYNWRTLVSIVYIAVFFTLPWIKIHGEPLFMLNILERKFILFSMIFWPQDFFLFVIAMLTFMVFIVLFTVVYGRVFCGWVCPQTIFMEMIFRKIEYFIDGDAEKQRRLMNSSWTLEKIGKRSAKFILFFSLSFIIANYFLAYLTGMDNVLMLMKEGIAAHLSTFIPLVIFTFVFFAVYWWFREQDACDAIMTKVHRPTGLIRYASENNIAKNEKLKVTPRMVAYSAVLLVLVLVLSGFLLSRKDVQATVMRAQGMLYQEQPDNKISNLYNIKLVNKTRKDIPVIIKVEDEEHPNAEIKMVGKPLVVPKESIGDGVFFIILPKDQVHNRKNKIEIEIYSGEKKVQTVKTNFIAPNI